MLSKFNIRPLLLSIDNDIHILNLFFEHHITHTLSISLHFYTVSFVVLVLTHQRTRFVLEKCKPRDFSLSSLVARLFDFYTADDDTNEYDNELVMCVFSKNFLINNFAKFTFFLT